MKKIIFSSRPSSKKSKTQKTPKGPIKGDYLIVSIDQNGNEMPELPTGLTVEPSVKGQLADDVTKISFSTKTVQNLKIRHTLARHVIQKRTIKESSLFRPKYA